MSTGDTTMDLHGAIARLSDDDVAWLRAARRDAAASSASDAARGDRTDAWFAADNPNAYDLERAFAGVHFLLTGTADGGEGPLSFVANAAFGERVAYDFGLGAGRLLAPPTVSAIADAIESMVARVVRERLSSDALRSVYPFSEHPQRPLADDDKEWLLAVLQGLMVFVRRAATDRVSLVVAHFRSCPSCPA